MATDKERKNRKPPKVAECSTDESNASSEMDLAQKKPVDKSLQRAKLEMMSIIQDNTTLKKDIKEIKNIFQDLLNQFAHAQHDDQLPAASCSFPVSGSESSRPPIPATPPSRVLKQPARRKRSNTRMGSSSLSRQSSASSVASSDGEQGSTNRSRCRVRLGTAGYRLGRDRASMSPQRSAYDSSSDIESDAPYPSSNQLSNTYVICPAPADAQSMTSPAARSTVSEFEACRSFRPPFTSSHLDSDAENHADDSDSSDDANETSKRMYNLHQSRMETPIRIPGSRGILKSRQSYLRLRDLQSAQNTPATGTPLGSRPSPVGAYIESPIRTVQYSPRVTFLDEVCRESHLIANESLDSEDMPEDTSVNNLCAPPNSVNTTCRQPPNSVESIRPRAPMNSPANCCDSLRERLYFSPPLTECASVWSENTVIQDNHVQPTRVPNTTPVSSNTSSVDSRKPWSVDYVREVFKLPPGRSSVSTCPELNGPNFELLDQIEKEFIKSGEEFSRFRADLSGETDLDRDLVDGPCDEIDIHSALKEPCSSVFDESITLLECSNSVDQLSESGFESTLSLALTSSPESCSTSISSRRSGRPQRNSRRKSPVGSDSDCSHMKAKTKPPVIKATSSKFSASQRALLFRKQFQNLPRLPTLRSVLPQGGGFCPSLPASLEVTINSTPDITNVLSPDYNDVQTNIYHGFDHSMMEHNFQSVHGRDYCDSLSSSISMSSVSTDIPPVPKKAVPHNTPASSYEPSPIEKSHHSFKRINNTKCSDHDKTLRADSNNNQMSIALIPSPSLSPISSVLSHKIHAPANSPMSEPISSSDHVSPVQSIRNQPVKQDGIRKQLRFRSPFRTKKEYKSRKEPRQTQMPVLPSPIHPSVSQQDISEREQVYKKKKSLKKKFKMFSNYFQKREKCDDDNVLTTLGHF